MQRSERQTGQVRQLMLWHRQHNLLPAIEDPFKSQLHLLSRKRCAKAMMLALAEGHVFPSISAPKVQSIWLSKGRRISIGSAKSKMNHSTFGNRNAEELRFAAGLAHQSLCRGFQAQSLFNKGFDKLPIRSDLAKNLGMT